MNKGQRPKIGLALGSGGARGYAHIGVIKALEAAGIPIDFIAGSSIGAMVGGFYASGRSIQYIENLALGADWRKVFATLLEPSFRRGFLAGEKAKAFIQEHTDKKTFEECRIPFVAVVTDMKTGEPVILDQGDLATAIRASTSIPLVFRPFMVDGRMLADGGLSVPVPAEIVRSMGADIVIAVNLDGFLGDEAGNLGWYDIANDSLNILRHHLARANVAKADLVINISLRDVAWYDFVNGEDKIVLGEQSMRRLIPKLKRLIVQKAKSSKQSLWNAIFE